MVWFTPYNSENYQTLGPKTPKYIFWKFIYKRERGIWTYDIRFLFRISAPNLAKLAFAFTPVAAREIKSSSNKKISSAGSASGKSYFRP